VLRPRNEVPHHAIETLPIDFASSQTFLNESRPLEYLQSSRHRSEAVI